MKRLTDFLEELLNGQVEEEEEQVLLQPSRRLVKTARAQQEERFFDLKRAGTPEEANPERRKFAIEQREATASLYGLQTGDGNDAAYVTGMKNQPAQFLWEMVRRTYSAARLWQVRAVRPSGSIFETNGPANRQIYGLHKQDSIIPGYAAQVDAVFARDARRYDGPLRIL